MPNILIVGYYNRKDYLDLFKGCLGYCKFYFIDYASKKEISNDFYKTYGEAVFWGDFKNATELLLHVKPHKVVFFFIESYYHVLMNLACQEHGIPTYLIDHGIRDININIRFETHLITQASTTSPSSYIKKLLQFKERLKARYFLRNSVNALSKANSDFFWIFYRIRKNNGVIATLNKIASPLRVANAYISFSPKVYEVHKLHDHLPNDKRVHYIGIPSFDHLAGQKPAFVKKPQIVFLDQGLAVRRFFNWNKENYRQFLEAFANICTNAGYQLLVKLHPIQPHTDVQLWNSFQNVKVIDNEELTLQLPYTQLIIGFFSTYLLPLMALPFTTVLTLENHPIGKINVSKSFIEAGVAHPIYNLEELHGILQDVEALHQKQLPNKAKFTEEWMYKFDGKAGERLRDILLSDDL
ncbi:polysialyltransferase family glycosyltransferase [Pontibacter diazotrophicus]|nr:polysialyltransferase family glycosyltransferase [Pontibacter diazotrophicus]